MKKLMLTFTLIAVSLIANSQEKNIQAMIGGYKLKDTINLADFIKLKELTLNNKDYNIIKYTLSYNRSGSEITYTSNSQSITNEMKNDLIDYKKSYLSKDMKFVKIYMDDITIQSPQKQELKTQPLTYYIRIQ